MIRVISAGPLTTVQDGGRHGWAHIGVPTAGPADPLAHAAANRLVGNPAGSAALESTVLGPQLRFNRPVLVAAVGAELRIDGVGAGARAEVPPGKLLQVGPAERVRSYLAVSGGIDVEPVLGSRSTDTLSGLGPAPLSDGDTLEIGTERGRPDELPEIHYDTHLRILPGPHAEWFSAGLGEFTVDPRSDRIGVRLTGAAVARKRSGELPVEGMVTGAVQVPPDGNPIILLPDHGVTGGYPVIAVVISADIHKIGQLPPGAAVTFEEIDRATAGEEFRRRYGNPSR
ncbi:MAG TPA: biotin-dependent carboxyltransferase family protein [Mycobacteriales bacterium]|nr:biotin-dependent carboxyltransferase family protein [Mycobacteriales bacterium]